MLRRLLQTAPFNVTRGWEGVGRPSKAVPRDDHVWWRRRGHTRVVDADDWGFVGNDKDQAGLGPTFASTTSSILHLPPPPPPPPPLLHPPSFTSAPPPPLPLMLCRWQGLLFYLLRVRHRLGADIRLTPCARNSSRPTM